jgi:predicted nucleotidyltransferase
MKTNHIKVKLPNRKIADFCRRHNIRKLAVFGSALREDFRPDSDLDVLVEFEPGITVGYIGLYPIEQELAGLLGGRKLDLVNPKFLNHRIRDRVLSEAQVQYAEG